MKVMNECETCPYCYKGEYDKFPCCQYPRDEDGAPCEYTDVVEEVDEFDFDEFDMELEEKIHGKSNY